MAAQLISEAYRAEQKLLHRSGDYGRSGAKWLDRVLEIFDGLEATDVLDYGCGKGFLGQALRENGVVCYDYDPAMDGKTYAKPADLVVCTDVMEHIEPVSLQAVLMHLIEVTKVALFVAISTRPAGKKLSSGKNAHLIIQPCQWWREQFDQAGFRVKKIWISEEQEWVALMRPRK